MKTRILAGLMALAVSSGLLFVGAPAAHASSKGRLNTTYALGAASIFSLLKGKTMPGLVLGAGTAYAYKRYNDSKKSDQRRARLYSTRYYRAPRTTRYARAYRSR
jgi:hypothetical protein